MCAASSAALPADPAAAATIVLQGVKLELFIFDTFPLASSTALFEVRREEEFAPVKNAPGQGLPDSPDTARDAILALHKG
jgi:UDP-N-acetylglucosamine/UDP-N-acetylgalactosamine diphosphorylase